MSTAEIDKLAATAERLKQTIEEASIAWPQPTEIKADLPPAPVFDGPTLLPKVLCDFVLDEADRMPCSPDYCAAALIVALGAVIGARCAIKPKRRDDWIVTPNLFGGVVGDPSSKKTPGINTSLRFLDRLEAKEAERHAERMKVFEAETAAFQAWQAAIQGAMKKAAAGKGDGLKMDSAVADMQALAPPEEPRQRRFKTNDGTVAKIGDILVGNPSGLLVFRDELIGLLASWEKEGNEGDRAFYLEGFNGTGSFNIDRIARGSLFVKTLCLSVFGGIQPDLLERYLSNIVNSMDNDGRIQRFQLLVYPEQVPWAWRDRYPVKGAREAARDLFDRLADFDPVQDGATPADDFVKLPYFSFDDAAQEVFIEWSTELHLKRIASEDDPLMRQHLAKFEKLFCSLALILHLAEGRIGPVQQDTAVRAAAWCVYLEGHARRVYAMAEVAKVSVARKLGKRLLDRKLLDGFTARDVVRKGWTGLATTLQAEAALAVLEEHGWTVSNDLQENIGRPTTRHYINPKIYGGTVIDWIARAKAQLAQPAWASTDKTDETPVLSVSSVPPTAISAECSGVSSVSSVVSTCVALTANGGLINVVPVIAVMPVTTPVMVAMPVNVDRGRGNPYMTPEQGDDCHACGWDDAEIALFMARSARFAQIGRLDAEHLAERLTLRDRQADDRRMCIECRELELSGRCAAARRGAVPGADRRMEPVQTNLLRCLSFRCVVTTHEFKQGNDHASLDD